MNKSVWQITEAKHDCLIQVRLTGEERYNLEYIARSEKRNISDEIRHLIWEEYKKKLNEEI